MLLVKIPFHAVYISTIRQRILIKKKPHCSTGTVFTNSSFSLLNICDLPKPNSVLGDISISKDEVSKAMGCDSIGPKLLKHCATALYQPFHHLLCERLAQQYIPFEWHTHLIKPIFKTGDRSSVMNYRPISLLCVSSKVLERIVTLSNL